ncbi:hypothetical protein [Mycobacterium paraterrae]|uniref:Uncharacterized protein n=1 Tax=Mycobacterium paraterrae TaxID=577492 RepID=A0ABY3VIV1_9MYCO|nr:hypothetical protein [Mycobacterium paraterrae]UMB69325.1 hypothetical protein MKK62_23725 [Mycobacterium paraterrae]
MSNPLTGTSDAAFQAGVTGTNTNTTPQAGVGVYGKSAAAGVLGENTASWHGVAGIGGPKGGEGVNGVSHSGWAGVGGYNKSTGPGVWGIGGATAGEGVHGESNSGYAAVAGYNKSTGPGVWGIGGATAGEGVHGESHSGYAAVAGYNTNNGPGLWGIGGPHGGEGVHGESHSGSAAVAGYSKGGGPAGWFDGNVVVTGDVILQGADYAEALTTTDDEVAPGVVVVFDTNGELRPCRKEYDTAVAGIVSGARGVKPAIVLDRHANSAPVALMGTVWCYAEAARASIRPGDLLTTSITPGHCQRATENTRAFGAVIGKALTSLESGRGMVRVFVSPR